jgi:hypothetical protein
MKKKIDVTPATPRPRKNMNTIFPRHSRAKKESFDKIDTKFQRKTQESDVVGQIEDWMTANKMNLQNCGHKNVTSVNQRENMLEREAGKIRTMDASSHVSMIARSPMVNTDMVDLVLRKQLVDSEPKTSGELMKKMQNKRTTINVDL